MGQAIIILQPTKQCDTSCVTTCHISILAETLTYISSTFVHQIRVDQISTIKGEWVMINGNKQQLKMYSQNIMNR
jgi:hypothetical protein